MAEGLTLIVYGALLGLGGLAAFKREKNRMALNFGGVTGTILVLCGAIAWLGYAIGSYVGLFMTLLMILLFTMRYRKTKKIRPAGFMMVVSIIVFVTVLYFLIV